MTARDDRTDEMIALEQARAQLEIGLSGDASWLALRDSTQSHQNEQRTAQLKSALAGNPLYKSWLLVTEAIEHLRAQQAEEEISEPALEANMGPPDDLTRIRGIGLDLARRLAVLGVTHYRTIADWRPVDVRTVSATLGLGRQVSRQNWIEQAALLQHRVESTRAGAATTTAHAETVRSPPAAQEAAGASQAKAEQRKIDLPDILEAIRGDALADGTEPQRLASSVQSPADPSREPDAEQLLVALDTEGATTPTPPSEAAADPLPGVKATVAAPQAPTTERPVAPTVAGQRHVDTETSERAGPLDQEWQNRSNGGPADNGEAAEATVTFIVREPVVSPRRRAPASDLALPRRDAGDGSQELFVPPNSQIDEAEVEILGTDRSKGAGATASRPTGAVKRLLKTLTGS